MSFLLTSTEERKERQSIYVGQLKLNLPAEIRKCQFPDRVGCQCIGVRGLGGQSQRLVSGLGSKIILWQGLGVSMWLRSMCSQDHE